MRLRIAIICAALVALSGWAYGDAGVSVSPPFQVLTITKSQAQAGFTYTVTNNDPTQTAIYSLSAVDFGSLNDSGGIVFLGTTPAQIHKYGLVNWLNLAPTQFSLAPKQTEKVQVTVTNSDSLAPGGHYGAILVTQQPSGAANTGTVVIRPVVSTLMFVDKLGGEKYALKLSRLDRDKNWWQSLTLKLTFQNSGNIDVVPRGVVQLINPQGKEVARAAVNEESSRILPETKRVYTIPLINTGRLDIPGKYQLKVQYRYDGQPNFTTYTTSFYYFSFWVGVLIVSSFLVVIAVAIATVAWLVRRRRSRLQKGATST